jgi:hypothetical protein
MRCARASLDIRDSFDLARSALDRDATVLVADLAQVAISRQCIENDHLRCFTAFRGNPGRRRPARRRGRLYPAFCSCRIIEKANEVEWAVRVSLGAEVAIVLRDAVRQ